MPVCGGGAIALKFTLLESSLVAYTRPNWCKNAMTYCFANNHIKCVSKRSKFQHLSIFVMAFGRDWGMHVPQHRNVTTALLLASNSHCFHTSVKCWKVNYNKSKQMVQQHKAWKDYHRCINQSINQTRQFLTRRNTAKPLQGLYSDHFMEDH